MTHNLLVTPNVIINCLLLYEQETPTYNHFLDKFINLSRQNNYSIFMTELDLEVVNYYYDYFSSILKNLSDDQTTDYCKNLLICQKLSKLSKIISSVQKYLNIAQKYPIDEDILNLATCFLINNPSDAIRLATAIAGEKLRKKINIDVIITWEPSHFCQETDNYFAIRKSGYGKIRATMNNGDTAITKRIYTPSHFMQSSFIDDEHLPGEPVFYLIDIEIQSNINSQELTSQNVVKVTIKYNNESYSYTQNSDSGIVSTLILAIHICIKRKCLNSDFAKRKLIPKNLIKKMIFSVSPVMGYSNQIHADIMISDQDIQATKRGSNLLCSTGEAYIEILNHVINRSTIES
jgi:hypothetical protein